jgi:hypothetical protein
MEEDVAATQNGSHRHQANSNEIKPDGACLQKSTHIKKTLELCQLVKRKETTTTTTTTTTTSGTKGKRRKKKRSEPEAFKSLPKIVVTLLYYYQDEKEGERR